MQLKNFKYAHASKCPGPPDSVVARAKDNALKTFSGRAFDDQQATKPNRAPQPDVLHQGYHAAPPEPQRDYSYLLAHMLN